MAVVMITDIFGRTERFNSPGVSSGANWTRRIHVPIALLGAEPVLPAIRQLLQETGRVSR
jgi:4-alpha-glucanotransferase